MHCKPNSTRTKNRCSLLHRLALPSKWAYGGLMKVGLCWKSVDFNCSNFIAHTSKVSRLLMGPNSVRKQWNHFVLSLWNWYNRCFYRIAGIAYVTYEVCVCIVYEFLCAQSNPVHFLLSPHESASQTRPWIGWSVTSISNNSPVIHQRQIVMCSVYIHQIKEAYGESDKFWISSFIVHVFDGIQMQLDEWSKQSPIERCAPCQQYPNVM